MREFMAKAIHYVHWLIVAFVLTAWAWPWSEVLWVHALFVPLMIVHWRTNRNRCILTQLELRFQDPNAIEAAGSTVEAEERQFVKVMFKKVFGRAPSSAATNTMSYSLALTAWLLTVIRLTLQLRAS